MFTFLYFSVCVLTFVVSTVSAAKLDYQAAKDYEGYQLLEIIPQSESDLNILSSLSNVLGENIDFWKKSVFIGSPTEIFVSPKLKRQLLNYLDANSQMTHSVKLENVGQIVRDDAIDTPRPPPSASFDENIKAINLSEFDFNEYHAHHEINNYLKALADEYKFVQLGSVGKSHEGREMLYIKIGFPSDEPKNAFFVDAGIHAREWITPAVALHFINKLVTNIEMVSLLEDIDIYVLPSVNPDGYEYSRNVERLWRKTRSGPRGANQCYGVDPNRNFDFYWAYSGVSQDPCSEIYCGPNALSEVESQSLSQFLQSHNNSIKAYVSLHSYGNLIIHPWGHKLHAYPADVNDIICVAKEMAQAISEAGGPDFTVGTGPEILYEVAGSSQDYAESLGIKYSYTIELTNTFTGFVLPKSKIQTTADHVLPPLLLVAEKIRSWDEQSESSEYNEIDQ